MQVLKAQAGDYDEVGCDIRDMYNYGRDMREANRKHNAQFFVDSLRRKQEVDLSFYFAYEMDHDSSLKHVFWLDPVARKITACLVTFSYLIQPMK